jgi:hypothetical protein
MMLWSCDCKTLCFVAVEVPAVQLIQSGKARQAGVLLYSVVGVRIEARSSTVDGDGRTTGERREDRYKRDTRRLVEKPARTLYFLVFSYAVPTCLV